MRNEDGKATDDPEDLLLESAELLFVDGQTTERMVDALARLGMVLGFRTTVLPHWGELTIHIDSAAGPRQLHPGPRPSTRRREAGLGVRARGCPWAKARSNSKSG